MQNYLMIIILLEDHPDIVQLKISFYDPEPDNPDHIVNTWYSTMTAAVSEAQCGVEKFWQRCRSNGMRDHENFGMHISQTYFKAFMSAAPYCFSNKK